MKSKITKVKFLPDCCDESKQDLRDWIECGFKFCPWCGRELRPSTSNNLTNTNIKFATSRSHALADIAINITTKG